MSRIVIIGTSGMIGTELERQARAQGREVFGTYATNEQPGLIPFDVTKDDIAPLLKLGDVVFLLAAMIDQAQVAAQEEKSTAINKHGNIRCVDAAMKCGADVIFMSSEAALRKPLTLYGTQKRDVERYLCGFPPHWCVARTGSVTGWRKTDLHCTITKTYDAIRRSGAQMAPDNFVTITDVRDVAAGLLKIADAKFHGFVNLVADPAMSRTQLADEIIRRSRFGRQMSYCLMSRPQAAPLVAENPARLALSFAPPLETIARKVALLDC